VPSFQEHTQHLATWRELPGIERLGDGVALTFDDGPDADATEALLDALDAAGARATFFFVGEQLLAHQDVGVEVARRGHQIGLHCFRHEPMGELGADATREDLLRGLEAIEATTGERPALFRPPYGWLGKRSYAAALDLGLQVVYWSAWGMDWEPLPAERIAELVLRDLASGVIVLLHDSPRYAARASAAPTVQALPQILDACFRRGLPFAGLPG
jgi:peptidoglycan-N-acetylglucosamine deacetylase